MTPESARPGFRPHFETVLARLPQRERERWIADARCFLLPGTEPPWRATGIRVARGDRVSLLAAGRLVWSAELDLWAGPSFHLWGRVGLRGPIFKATRDTFTIEANGDGELYLGICHGEWATPEGDLATPVEAYATLLGSLEVLVIRWRADPAAGLEALRTVAPEDPLILAELAHLKVPAQRPPGWDYLWFLGEREIFSLVDGQGKPTIALHAENDTGILRHPLELELRPDTELSWSWRVTQLPATEPENAFHCHDYLSLAVEFENGQDLTYYWSSTLPVGTHYRCPLPTWTSRETHIVVRSGEERLGDWLAERRYPHRDYSAVIGEAPERIVAVWLIAVSCFRHRTAAAEFREIALSSSEGPIRVV